MRMEVNSEGRERRKMISRGSSSVRKTGEESYGAVKVGFKEKG